jgi:hypothetical protein
MTSRNKVPAALPRWADPFARAYYWGYKTADRQALRLQHWQRARLGGLERWGKEHFSVFVARAGSACATRLAAPGWSYLADPFLWRHDGRLWLFAEAYRYREDRGQLCALPLDDALRSDAPLPVLDLGTHASFPFLFAHEGETYLLPETHEAGTVDLYRCVEFPRRWRLVRRILHGIDAADSIIIRHQEKWFLLTSVREAGRAERHLAIYWSDDLLAERWQPHPVNAEQRYGQEKFGSMRNAGTPLSAEGMLLRPVQLSRRYYGQGLGFMRIDTLTTTEFRESPAAPNHPLAAMARIVAPHHVSTAGDVMAWDVRDRVGLGAPAHTL